MIKVEKCLFVNRAPFKEDLEIVFKDGVNVLCGINGRGKTTILSYIADAFFEMAKLNYQGSFEGKESKYYRLSSSSHLIDVRKPSIVYIRFIIDDTMIDYIDVRGKLSETDYNLLVKYSEKVDYGRIKSGLSISDTVKTFSCDDSDAKLKEAFLRDVITYFPSYRYELPGYLNNPYKTDVEIGNATRFSGELPNPLEVHTGLNEFSSWVLDVVLDWEVNKQTQKINNPTGTYEIDVTPERNVWNNLSQLLKSILVSKNYSGRVRFGIGRRNKRGNRISIMHDISNTQQEQLCPNLSLLSSGEIALLCLFGEIIRQADNLNINIPLEQIRGIVLIDEIEKHLHIRLQKEILPKLLKLFPNVQFIVSSHSPFFNIGLASETGLKSQIYDLDNGAMECEPTTNEEYQNTYELFLGERNKYASALAEIRPKIELLTRPLVITEGKTDIKHILKAMEMLGIERQFDVVDETEQPDGDGSLKTIIQNLCKIKQNRKIIAIFDRDNPKVTNDIYDPYKDFGNNVYALRIKCPQCRIDEGRTSISIEYMYTDDEIHSILPNNCQLFFGNEFNMNSRRRHLVRTNLFLSEKKGCGEDKIIENNGGQAVFDDGDNNILAKKDDFANAVVNGDITISPQSWENFRPTIDMINQIIAL